MQQLLKHSALYIQDKEPRLHCRELRYPTYGERQLIIFISIYQDWICMDTDMLHTYMQCVHGEVEILELEVDMSKLRSLLGIKAVFISSFLRSCCRGAIR